VTSTPRDNSARGLGTGTGPVRRPPAGPPPEQRPDDQPEAVKVFELYYHALMACDAREARDCQRRLRELGLSVIPLAWVHTGERARGGRG
jgi:hypothetical protein